MLIEIDVTTRTQNRRSRTTSLRASDQSRPEESRRGSKRATINNPNIKQAIPHQIALRPTQ